MNTVMIVSLVLCAAIAIWGVVDPDSMTGSAQWLVNYSLTALDWYFLALCTTFLVIMGYMAFSKYGKIKLGADDDEPEFSTGSWIAMLFAAGMGSGLLFWGVAEPIYHFMTPPVGEGETAMAARNAMVITNLHWGLHAWSIYGCCALVIAYFTFRLGLPSMVSTPILVGFKNVFGKSTLKQIGNTADILAVIAVIFGLAGSLILGFLDLQAGHAQSRFYNELEDWLSNITELQSADDGTNTIPPQLRFAMVDMQRSLSDLNEKVETRILNDTTGDAVKNLSQGVDKLIRQMRAEQKVVREWADEQSQQQHELAAVLRQITGKIPGGRK